MAGFKNIFGGELKGYTELLSESREEAIDRLKQQAAALGAKCCHQRSFLHLHCAAAPKFSCMVLQCLWKIADGTDLFLVLLAGLRFRAAF